MSRCLHCIVSGMVQGVFFRAFTVDAARSLRLRGWVRNLPDGRVETLAEGERESLERFRRWLHDGSPLSRVARVEAAWLDADDGRCSGLTDFRVRK